MKTIKIGDLKVKVCEHKGDILYTRYVKFKQYAPQFWEKMDSVVFEAYYEGILDMYNNGKFAEAIMKLKDYRIALDNSANSYDAWGMCFGLICEIVDGKEKEKFKQTPDDSDIKDKLEKLNEAGLTAETVKAEVINFMKASPETFADHII